MEQKPINGMKIDLLNTIIIAWQYLVYIRMLIMY